MDAEVYINGQFRGTTPFTVHLTTGTHTIEFRFEGYQAWSRELAVVAGNDTRLKANMVPE